jgi:hypothetical protein
MCEVIAKVVGDCAHGRALVWRWFSTEDDVVIEQSSVENLSEKGSNVAEKATSILSLFDNGRAVDNSSDRMAPNLLSPKPPRIEWHEPVQWEGITIEYESFK